MRLLTILVLLAATLLLLSSALFQVQQGEIGLVTRFGRPLEQLAEPGLHLKWPWPVDAVVRIDRRLLVFDNEPIEMLTLDKKNVLVDSFLCWRIVDPLRFAQTLGGRLEAEARLLDLTVAELGAAVGQEAMDGFVNPDPARVRLRQVAEEARAKVDAVTRESFGIAVLDLEINGFGLPRQNRQSVIERMQAERRRIATAYRSEGEEEALKITAEAQAEAEGLLAEARSQAEVLRGEGEAAALRLLAEAYAEDPELYRFLRTLESYDRILDDRTTLILDSDSELLETLRGR